MSSLTIVALPVEGDPVWRSSSETVPHLTLLYLGEDVDPDQEAVITRFVEHASSMLDRFGLGVDHRGPLGDQDADVVFFNREHAHRIQGFRNDLLLNDAIKKAYKSTFQYPEWTPHLTLGYPHAPATELDYPITWVQFDRIAVWNDDFSGPEYLLKEHMMADDVLHVDEVEEFLAHYGVKGMKWGQRKAENRVTKNGGRTRKETRALNKSNRAKYRAEDKAKAAAAEKKRVSSIERARKDLKNFDNTRVGKERSKARAEFKETKKAYKADKAERGRVAARRKLGEARTKKWLAEAKYSEKYASTLETARQYKDGYEFATTALASAYGVSVDWSKAS